MLAKLTALGCCVLVGGSVTASTPAAAWSITKAAATAPAPPPSGAADYAPPTTPMRVVRPFDPPADPYGPGHRGVDLATSPGESVRTAGSGTVGFAGDVAGRGVVVIVHPGGLRTEYEPLVVRVRAGQRVARGETIGTVAGSHGSCAPGACLHWSARRGDTYLDPLTLLAPLGPVRLLPW